VEAFAAGFINATTFGPTLEGQRQAVIEELARIRRELENGTFPIRKGGAQ
jgi:hypothetical protein